MIPDGTPPEAIILAVVTVVIVASTLMAALFWFTLPKKEGPSVRGAVSSLFAAWASRVPTRMGADNRQTETDRQTDLVSEADRWLDRLEVDRTKTAVIELLVYSGWEVGQIRGVLKGDNGVIGTEIEAAKVRLGITEPPRQLRVRDAEGERLIPMEG